MSPRRSSAFGPMGALFLGLLLALPLEKAVGQGQVYGAKNSPALLFEIDTTSGLPSLAKDGLPETIAAIARHPCTGEVYMVGNAGANAIVTWNPATDVVTVINPGGGVQYHRFGFDADCNLYGVPLNSKAVFQVDPLTGVPTFLGSMSGLGTGGSVGDLAFAPGATKEFFYAVDDDLYLVPLATLQAQLIGDAGTSDRIEGLGFEASGRLIANDRNNVYELDPATAQSTLLGPLTSGKLNDLTGALDPLFLRADPEIVNTGAILTLTMRRGAPGAPVALVVTGLNGSPLFQIARVGVFDASGEWTNGGAIPAEFAGLQLELSSLGITTFGTLVLTNAVAVSIL